jgi:hypothetical protein
MAGEPHQNPNPPPPREARFHHSVRLLEAAHAEDPRQEPHQGAGIPAELLFARRVVAWVLRLRPDASELLLLAAHAQHLRRWKIPRSQFPLTRSGYHAWRNHLKKFHADEAGRILEAAGYGTEEITVVEDLVSKKNFPLDPDSQVIEDALCLVFLEHQFSELNGRTAREKMINAVRKSWNKMSLQAREFALGLSYGTAEREVLAEALKNP